MSEREQADVMMPDRAARARLCVLAALVLFTAMVGVHLLQQHVLELLRTAADDPALALDRLRTLAKLLALAISYALLAVAVWLRGVALRTLEQKRYPPRGVTVLRPTRVVEGYAARLRGRTGLLCAGLLIGSAFVLPLSLLSIFAAIEKAVH